MSLWEANIPEVPYGIPSDVHRVRVGYILSWKEPAIFGRILKTFRLQLVGKLGDGRDRY